MKQQVRLVRTLYFNKARALEGRVEQKYAVSLIPTS